MPRKSERTRQRIIEAANRLFYRRGYNRTSFTDIVEAADVPRGNIYYYFRTKEDILRAALEHRLEIIDRMTEEWDRNFDEPALRLKRFVQVMVNSRQAAAEFGCPMGTLNSELAKSQRSLQKEAGAMFQRFIDYFERQFSLIGHTKEESLDLAKELLSRAQGVNMMSHVFSDPGYLSRQQETLNEWIDECSQLASVAAARDFEIGSRQDTTS